MAPSRRDNSLLPTLGAAVLAAVAICPPSSAKSVQEAIADLSQASDTDPQGFTLMLVSIGILLTCALTLIGATTFYMLKGKSGKS